MNSTQNGRAQTRDKGFGIGEDHVRPTQLEQHHPDMWPLLHPSKNAPVPVLLTPLAVLSALIPSSVQAEPPTPTPSLFDATDPAEYKYFGIVVGMSSS